LKKSFVSASILHHFDPERKMVLETDTSNLVIAGVLSQYDDNNILYPVAYFSRKHSPAEINYKIYDKKLLAFVQALKKWRTLLEGSPHTIEVISYHQNMTYLTTNHLLNYHQTPWMEFLSPFGFKINHRLRMAHGNSDALIWQGKETDEDSDLYEVYGTPTLLKSRNLSLLRNILLPNGGPTFFDLLQTVCEADPCP
jgi:hypothetical protein